MTDRHIDLDDIDRMKSGQKAESAAEQPLDDFDNPESRGKDGYRFWGWQRLPEMLRDFSGQFGPKMRMNSSDVLPEDTMRHLRTSQREFLLAWRSLIDRQLERLSAQEEFDQARAEAKNGDVTLKVEVEEI